MKYQLLRIFTGVLALFWLIPAAAADAGQRGIACFDLTYSLFDSLGTYHDLTQAEEQRRMDVNQEIIPVLESIIEEFNREKAKLMQNHGYSPDMNARIRKIEQHVRDFTKELRYRQAALQYKLLMEKQKSIRGE
jgi:hypothetical protein